VTSQIGLLENVFDVRDGLVLEGTLDLPWKGARPVGLYIEHGEGAGTAIQVGPGGVSEIGPTHGDGTGFRCEERTDRQARFGERARFRLLLKQSLLEFYLDDLLMHCHAMPQKATGRIGIVGGGSEGEAHDLKAWR
jgi:hypothetical protein